MADNDPGTPKKVVVVHDMGRGPGRPVKTRSGLMVTADVVVAVAGVHHISWVAVRAGPSKHMGRLMGRASGPYRAHISWPGPGPAQINGP